MLPFTLTAADVATVYLKRSAKTFANLRQQLFAAGFPRPIDLGCPSDPIWLRQSVEDWLAGRPAKSDDRRHLDDDTPLPVPGKRGRGRPPKRAATKEGGAA